MTDKKPKKHRHKWEKIWNSLGWDFSFCKECDLIKDDDFGYILIGPHTRKHLKKLGPAKIYNFTRGI